MDDRSRRILLGFALAGGALVLSTSAASAQSSSGANDPAPKSAVPFDDGPGGGARHGGCNGMGEADDTPGTSAAAELT